MAHIPVHNHKNKLIGYAKKPSEIRQFHIIHLPSDLKCDYMWYEMKNGIAVPKMKEKK